VEGRALKRKMMIIIGSLMLVFMFIVIMACGNFLAGHNFKTFLLTLVLTLSVVAWVAVAAYLITEGK
jgi:hypothetical protein